MLCSSIIFMLSFLYRSCFSIAGSTPATPGPTEPCSFNMADIDLSAPGCLVTDWFILDKDDNGGLLKITGAGLVGPDRTAIKSEDSFHSIFFCPLGTTLELQSLVLLDGSIIRPRAMGGGETAGLHYTDDIISGKIINHEPAHVFVFGGTLIANNVWFFNGQNLRVSGTHEGNNGFGGSVYCSVTHYYNNGSTHADNHKMGKINITGSTFQRNAAMKGGAIYFSASPYDDKVFGHVMLSGTRFEGNTAAVDAGAVYLHGCTGTEQCATNPSAGFGDGSNYFNNNHITTNIPALGGWSSNQPGTAEMLYSRGPMSFTACPGGTYSSQTDASVANSDKEFLGCPFLCPAGRYALSRTTDLTTCSNACPQGAYCPSGSAEPISCPAGKYSNDTSQTSPVDCSACPNGYITPASIDQTYWNSNLFIPLLNHCEACPVGSFATIQQSFCLPTEPGHYQNQSAQQEIPGDKTHTGQIKCPIGKYTSTSTNSLCFDCQQGKYAETEGTISCLNCDKGRYSNESGLISFSQCKMCPAGKFSGALGAHSEDLCVPCAGGRYGEFEGQAVLDDACLTCPNGFFSGESSTECTPCATGRLSEPGAVTCSVCQPGQYESSDGVEPGGALICVECPQGYISAQQNANTCNRCEIGKTAASNSAICLGCELGKFGHIEGFCQDCTAGLYQDSRGERKCKACPKDTFGLLAGRTSIADCKACPELMTTNGSTGNTKMGKCVCKEGFFYDDRGAVEEMKECLRCPVPQTDCSGRVNVTLRTLPSARGYYRARDDTTTFYKCDVLGDCKGGTADEQCRQGHVGVLCATCKTSYVRMRGVCRPCSPGQALAENRIAGFLLAGLVPSAIALPILVVYFSKENKDMVRQSVSMIKIHIPVQNDSALVSEIRSWSKTKMKGPRASTKANHLPPSRAKQQKLDFKKKDSERQEKTGANVEEKKAETSDTGDSTLNDDIRDEYKTAVSSKLTTAVETVVQANLRAGSSLEHKIRILIGYAQITSALVFSFDVPWPPLSLNFLKSLGFINFNFIQLFVPIDPCLFYTPFISQATFHFALLPIFGVLVTIAAMCAMKCNRPSTVKRKAGKVIVHFVFLLYPGIVTRVFTSLKCRQIGSAQYLVEDYSVVCWTGTHMLLTGLVVVCIGVYVLGIPLGTVLVLWRSKKLLYPDNFDESDEAQALLKKRSLLFQSVFGSLYEPYDKKYWWFESVIMIQKALLTGGLVMVAPGTSVQILIGLIIALIFYTLLLKLQPYAGKDEDQLQTIATASTVATLLIGFALKATTKDNTGSNRGIYDNNVMDVILLGLFIFVGLSGMWITLKSFRKPKEKTDVPTKSVKVNKKEQTIE